MVSKKISTLCRKGNLEAVSCAGCEHFLRQDNVAEVGGGIAYHGAPVRPVRRGRGGSGGFVGEVGTSSEFNNYRGSRRY
jgi:hypothetical protein